MMKFFASGLLRKVFPLAKPYRLQWFSTQKYNSYKEV
jgi:hypothetical protein